MEIYIDDLHVITGENRKNSKRTDTYISIEVLPYRKTVLLNVRYGEATFIVPRGLAMDELISLTKIDIEQKLGAAKIIFHEKDPEGWKIAIKQILQSGTSERRDRKTVFREKCIELYPCPKDFLALGTVERNKIKIFGRGLFAIGSLFGIRGNFVSNCKVAAELAQAIYKSI